MTDAELLSQVLDLRDLLPSQREAFEKMLKDLPRWTALTQRQREWVEIVAAKNGIAGASSHPRLTPKKTSAWDPGSRKSFQKQSRVR